MALVIKNGTSGPNSLTDTGGQGTASHWDIVYGLQGNDTINASGFTANVTTPNTGVQIYGGDGNDSIVGSSVKDVIYGGNGNDTISSGNGNDVVYGGYGNDSITGGTGNDNISGDAGNDTITGGAGNQTLMGGDGNDSINLGTDASTTDRHYNYGGTGNDTMIATNSAGTNYLYGGIGNDSMTGSTAGLDTLNGGWGTNSLNGGGVAGANHAHETAGFGDTYAGAAVGATGRFVGITANLTAGTASASGTYNGTAWSFSDTISNVDNVNGSNYNDTITGNANGNVIYGGAGWDSIDGGGDSTAAAAGVAPNTGNDGLYGGQGNDTIALHSGSQIEVTTAGSTSNGDTIDGGAGVNTLDFSAVYAGGAVSTLQAGSGTSDAISLPTVSSGTYANGTVTGVYVNLSTQVDAHSQINFAGAAGEGSINNIQNVIGTAGADYLVAIGGSTINGGAGADILVSASAGSGHDVLVGGLGNNVYDGTGSYMQDYFSVTNAGGLTLMTAGTAATKEFDTIYGFNEQQQDKIFVSAANLGVTVAATAAANANVDYTGATGTATIAGANASLFTAHYNALGNLSSVTLDATGVVLTTNAGLATVANATGHAEFVFNTDSGDLFYVPTGTAAGSLTASTYVGGTSAGGALTASNTAIAHVDNNSATFLNNSVHATNLDYTDFMLTA